MKNSCFWHKKPFLIFLAQVRTKWISESCSTAFLGPLCKNLGGVHLFFFKTLKIEIFSNGNPDREKYLLNKDHPQNKDENVVGVFCYTDAPSI